jgi:hypothetical protein
MTGIYPKTTSACASKLRVTIFQFVFGVGGREKQIRGATKSAQAKILEPKWQRSA